MYKQNIVYTKHCIHKILYTHFIVYTNIYTNKHICIKIQIGKFCWDTLKRFLNENEEIKPPAYSFFLNFRESEYPLEIWPCSHLLLQGGFGSSNAYKNVTIPDDFEKIKGTTINIPPGGCLFMNSWTVHRGLGFMETTDHNVTERHIFFASIDNGKFNNKDVSGALPKLLYDHFIENGLILKQ